MKPLPHLEDHEDHSKDSKLHSEKGEDLHLMVESTPKNSSKNSLYSQITPDYAPIYQPITISRKNGKNHLAYLASNLHQSDDNGKSDDEIIPLPELHIQDDKAPSPTPKEDKYKVKDHSLPDVSEKKPSLFQNLRSKISNRCNNIKESNLKVFLASSSLILMLINAALIVPFVVYFYHNRDTTLISANSALSYMAFSLSADPILDLKAKDPQSSCPQGYESLLLGIWPGMKPGCNCTTELHRGYCYRGRGASANCLDLSPINPIDLYDWDGSEWCVLKVKSGSQYKKAAKCSESFKKCSSGICVLETLDCPVTKINMENGTISTDSAVGELPVIGFTITPNDIPCFNDDSFARGPVDPYALINENEYGCLKYGLDDKYSFALGKEKQWNLYGQNDFPKKVYDLPAYLYVSQNTDSVLSYRKRLSVAEKDLCLNIDTGILERPSSVAKDLSNFLDDILGATEVLHGSLIGLVVIFIAIPYCDLKSFRKVLKGECFAVAWILIYCFIGFLGYIDFIVMFAAVVHYRAKMIGIKDYLAELAEEGCFLDLQAQAAVSDYQNIVNVVVGNFFRYSLSIFLVGTFAIFSCGYLCYLLWRSRGTRTCTHN